MNVMRHAVVLLTMTWCSWAIGQVANWPSPAAINLATPRHQDDARPVVGAYYYPWYGVNNRPVADDWTSALRQKLVPEQAPLAGHYRSDDAAVIAQHIAQSRAAGLVFWAVSWWGPGTATDRTLQDAILKHPDAGALRYAVLYESTGRLGPFDSPHYDQLVSDFLYLQEHFFGDANYLRINGRPVVFIYLTREYFRNRGLEELAEVRRQLGDVYIIGDDVFGPNYNAQWARPFDAVTAYDVYGQSLGPHHATRAAIDALAKNYAAAHAAANSVGAAFAPAVSPGYNDTAVRRGHPGSARYFREEPDSKEGDLFRAMIREAALPNLDDGCGGLMLVTSFNEWYEDTQIEATAGTSATTSSDNSDDQARFTGGDRYADYGRLYLEILHDETAGTRQTTP